jgi:hypothetical protein
MTVDMYPLVRWVKILMYCCMTSQTQNTEEKEKNEDDI